MIFFTKILSLITISIFFLGNVQAQIKTGAISGVVKTSDGKPATYVNITLKETKKTTQTNENGYYLINNVTFGTYTLKVSAVGMVAKEQSISLTDSKSINLDLVIAESSSQLNEVAITGYKTPNKKAATLGKVAIVPIDLPQSVQIIGSQVITDQQSSRLSDVLKNVNGVAYGENRGGVSGETFFARGYNLGGNNVLKNGSRASTGGMPETSTLESVEVLKGSAALLYGGVTGGAVVNLITKKPKFEFGGELSMRSGSYSLYKPIGDIYGPISKKLAFRLIGTVEDAGSYRNNVNAERIYVNPSLLYKINEKTDILLQGDYLKSDYTPDFGIGTVDNKIINIGRSTYLNAPNAFNNTNTVTTQLSVNHKINDNWKVNVIANLQAYHRNYYSAERPFSDASGITARNLTRSKTEEFTYNEQINLTGNIKTGNIVHTLIVGADADQSRITSNGFVYPGNATVFNYGNINLLNPSSINNSATLPETAIVSQTFAPTYRMGTFVQDLIALSDQFKVLAGIRYTFQKTPRTVTTVLATDTKTLSNNMIGKSKIETAFSPKFGLVYQPLKTTSFYVSYANNFISNTGIDIYNAPLDPSIVDQYEAGVKNDLFGGRVSANLTVYKIINNKFAQQALLRADGTANSDINVKELGGKTASEGIEFDLTGTIIKGLNFIAGYSYNFIRYTETIDKRTIGTTTIGGIVEGQRLVGTTRNTANGTLFYTFQKGLKLGASVYYTGDRNGGYNDSKTSAVSRLIPLGSFTTVDFSAGYTWKKLSLLGKVSNIGNEINYFAHDNYSINPIAPRMFVTTLSYRFN